MEFNLVTFLGIFNVCMIGYATYKDWRRTEQPKKRNVYSESYWKDQYGDFDGELFWSFMCRELDHVISCQERCLKQRMSKEEFDKYLLLVRKLLLTDHTKTLTWKAKFNLGVNRIRINSEHISLIT